MDNQTSVSIKFTNSVTGEKKLEKYAETLKQINMFLGAIDAGKAKELDSKIKGGSKETKEMAKNFNTAFDISKLTNIARSFERLITTISKYTKKSAEYLENINLLDVAFGGATEEADKFVNTLSEMYGLDESWGYRTVGMFKQLSNAMGLSDEVGTNLSKTLTQLSIDLSSLYNVDVNDAVSKLQSALAGQTKPVRFFGADITQNTLQLTLQTHGIDKFVSELSYAEKRLLIVASILEQTKEAQGDWGRTINSVANQMRIFQQQTERLTRALGNLFIPILEKILPTMNAILMVLTEIISWLATLVGFNEDDYDYFSGVDENVSDLIENLDGATESAKKLRNGLRGFDKLNNITTTSGTGTSGTGVSGDILGLYNKASEDYLKNLDKITNKATEIRDKIMEWLGFSKEIDEVTGDIKFKFEKVTSGTILGGLMFASLGASLFKTISNVLKKLGFGFSKTGGLSIFTKLTLLIGGLALNADAIKGLMNEGATWGNVLKSLGGATMTALGTFLLTKSVVLTLIVTAITLGTEAFLAVKNAWNTLMGYIDEYANNDGKTTWKEFWMFWWEGMSEEILAPLGNFLYDIFIKPFDELNRVVEKNGGYWENWKGGMKTIIEEVAGYFENLASKIQKAIDKWKAFYSLDTKDATYSIGDFFGDVKKNSKEAGGFWNYWWDSFQDMFKAEGGVFKNGSWQNITKYASGGLPPVGQMFVARERGPELVGKLGSSTAVMNNNQIVSSVSAGVYQAVRSAIPSNAGHVFNIYLDEDHKLGTYTLEQLQDMAKSNGEQLIIG